MDFSTYKALSFDCYGTLVDWETGILTALRPWAEDSGAAVSDAELIGLFGRYERQAEAESPAMLYPQILAEVQRRIADVLMIPFDDADTSAFGASVGDWPVFADTASALQRLAKHYKLFILSNVDRASLERSRAQMGIIFDGIVTAEDVGAYKPDPRNFEALLACVESAGISRQALLHVGESIYHDVIPGTRVGLDTAWIDRRSDTPDHPRASGALDPGVRPTFTFSSMAAFAAAAAPDG